MLALLLFGLLLLLLSETGNQTDLLSEAMESPFNSYIYIPPYRELKESREAVSKDLSRANSITSNLIL